MKVVITAGGKGERLKPLTNNIPKPMVLLKGKPVIEHIITHFIKHGFNDFILTLCYKGEAVVDYFGDGSRFGVKIDYTWEDENNPLGTAGGVGIARDLLDDTFMVVCGDALRSLDPNKVIRAHKEKKAFATLALHKPGKEPITSLVKFNKDYRLAGFIERPTSKQLVESKNIYMNSSLFILEPEIFEYVPKNVKVDFSYNVWPLTLAKSEKIYVYPTNDYVIDVGTQEKLDEAEKWLNQN